MSDWNPEMYLKFEKERTQPVHDLLSRVELTNPKSAIDIGCGPGNSTRAIKEKFPLSEVTGLDYSPAMIKKAGEDCPDAGISFITGDAGGDLSYLGKFDLVFANASLQWLPCHERLIPRLFSMCAQGGAFAAQIPQFEQLAFSVILNETVRSNSWSTYFQDFKSGMYFFPESLYYDVLSDDAKDIYIWSTEYYHVMRNHEGIVDWFKSTGLRPYLDRLPNDRREAFISEMLGKVKKAYPAQKNGRVIFKFKRLFIIAYK